MVGKKCIISIKKIKQEIMASKVPDTDSTNLMVAAPLIGSECAESNIAFLRCKQADANPEACLAQGENATACVLNLLRKVEKHCAEPFQNYKIAMDNQWHRLELCRQEQQLLENCWRDFKQQKKTNVE